MNIHEHSQVLGEENADFHNPEGSFSLSSLDPECGDSPAGDCFPDSSCETGQ